MRNENAHVKQSEHQRVVNRAMIELTNMDASTQLQLGLGETWPLYTKGKMKVLHKSVPIPHKSSMGLVCASQIESRGPVWSAKCHWYVHLIWRTQYKMHHA